MGRSRLRARRPAVADADRSRPGAPLSAGRQQEPQLHRRACRQRRLRPRDVDRDRQGAAGPAAADEAAGRRLGQRPLVRHAVVGDPCPSGHAVPGTPRRQLRAVPRHPRRRPVDRRGGGQEPAPGAAGRARPAPLRRRGSPRGADELPRTPGVVPAAAVRACRGRPLPLRRPGQHRAAGRADRRRRPGRTQVRAVRARDSRRAAPRAGHPRRDPRRRHPAAPPLPVVRAGRRVHPPCRQRSGRPVDQADGLPHRRQLGADGGADRGCALRQGGHRRHRTDGTLRRGDQHQLGGSARAGRRAGRLRRLRAQDPRQARPAAAPGNRPARPGAPGPVRAPRHRQLPPADDAPVHRLRAPDLRPRRLRRRRGRVHAHHQSRASRSGCTGCCWRRSRCIGRSSPKSAGKSGTRVPESRPASWPR